MTSDWHFCHSKPFIWEPRGLKNEWEMNKTIIANYNEVVQPEDDVYCLGDCMLSNDEEGLKCIKQLKGNLHIIRGNHDTDNRIQLYQSCYNVVEVCEAKFLRYGKYHFYLSHFPSLCSNYSDGKKLTQKTLNICGHTHTTDPFADWDKGCIYHCEVDAHSCYPVLLDNIIEEMKVKAFV